MIEAKNESSANGAILERLVRCKACQDRVKKWNVSDSACAFLTGEFAEENWNCATVNAVRDICYEGQELKNGIDYQYCEDDKYATVKIDHIEITGRPLALWVSWYKNRGCTQAMWLLFDKEPPRKPTEAECLAIVSAYT